MEVVDRTHIDEEISRCVHDEIPIRLIYIPTGELVDREFVCNHFRREIHRRLGGIMQTPDSETGRVQAQSNVFWTTLDVVAYATLSHRWGDGEPSYADYVRRWEARQRQNEQQRRRLSTTHVRLFQRGAGGGPHDVNTPPLAPTPGYEKLERFLAETSRRGIDFAWSDTCCIDKSSSAELDESIRSMFRWYRNSALCVVHLSQTTSVLDMGQDEWFRRGWTLQELLAPWRVKFMNRDWQPLTNDENDKRIKRVTAADGEPQSTSGFSVRSGLLGRGNWSISNQTLIGVVCETTRIPEAVFEREYRPRTIKIDERMGWAANRMTTRGEDAAYALMGMLGVSIQIAYGEGRARAFRRLFEAIVQDVQDPSVLHFPHPYVPRSPSDYLTDDPIDWRRCKLAQQIDMGTTRQGLRIRVAVISAEFVGTEPSGSDFRCQALNDTKFEPRDLNFDPRRVLKKSALGIVAYCEVEAKSKIAFSEHVIAYLLTSSWEVHHEDGHDGWGSWTINDGDNVEKWQLSSSLFGFDIRGSDFSNAVDITQMQVFFVDKQHVEYYDLCVPSHPHLRLDMSRS
ncbi:hypothetical protein CONPUDRAFT_168372 [Coniophora puteana RWD-64-598 SS2]|uniref:Heterokaryon incompatibility domain-containing protein n=1 Tax=Coniophora puteana (strain RWD-64-598) TaxID=741705 RepID=A0A5M3MDZ2_CONPW|nr:uncharacterized protein CONPUDRAFT_168372 [Coniophora puteana RWD-64-598 SS2]EIW77448.1 hypothetical protein CONPUDRAFT_168372 [Coniophora puteana RWD-64-598 SS2]